MTKCQMNDLIRAAKIAVSDAEFEGLRGEEMLAVKANLRRLQAIYARDFK